MTTLDLTKEPIVGYCYWNDGDQDPLLVCLECDDKFIFPPAANKAKIRDGDQYGNSVPHARCQLCDTQVTS